MIPTFLGDLSLVVMILVSAVARVTQSSPHQGNIHRFNENLERLQRYGMCSVPKPRVFYVGKCLIVPKVVPDQSVNIISLLRS